jgi:hypothetical protein
MQPFVLEKGLQLRSVFKLPHLMLCFFCKIYQVTVLGFYLLLLPSDVAELILALFLLSMQRLEEALEEHRQGWSCSLLGEGAN